MGESVCVSLVSPDGSTHALLYDAVVLVPNLVFLVYLCFNARKCYDILQRNPSMIMWTYYSLVWAVCVCNMLRAAVQLLGGMSAHSSASVSHLWDVLWLFTRFVMLMLEVSVVVFLLHGYVASSGLALRRTIMISFAIAAVEALVKSIYIWSLDVPLYTLPPGADASDPAKDMVWSKWSFWLVHTLAFSAVYLGLMLLPWTRWRDLLPAKDSFNYYVRVLLAINVVAAVGAILIGTKHLSGYCFYGVANALYYAGYAALLYVTFLANFFQSDDLDLENYYYSEMSQAGFLDSSNDPDDPFASLVA